MVLIISSIKCSYLKFYKIDVSFLLIRTCQIIIGDQLTDKIEIMSKLTTSITASCSKQLILIYTVDRYNLTADSLYEISTLNKEDAEMIYFFAQSHRLLHGGCTVWCTQCAALQSELCLTLSQYLSLVLFN